MKLQKWRVCKLFYHLTKNMSTQTEVFQLGYSKINKSKKPKSNNKKYCMLVTFAALVPILTLTIADISTVTAKEQKMILEQEIQIQTEAIKRLNDHLDESVAALAALKISEEIAKEQPNETELSRLMSVILARRATNNSGKQ